MPACKGPTTAAIIQVTLVAATAYLRSCGSNKMLMNAIDPARIKPPPMP